MAGNHGQLSRPLPFSSAYDSESGMMHNTIINNRPRNQEPLAMSPSAELTGVFGNRSGPRSRRGCWVCREKKVKCDESKPRCQRCTRLSRDCDYSPRQRKRASRHSRMALSQRNTSVQEPETMETAQEGQSSQVFDFCKPVDRVDAILPLPADPSLACCLVSPLTSMPLPTVPSTSGLELSHMDHETIRYYHTSFAPSQHTKNPRFSMFSIIFGFAEVHPLVMHMVVAVAGRDLAYQISFDDEESDLCLGASRHYCEAIRLMGKAMQKGLETATLENIFAALWLMIAYEQRFGDGSGKAISAHLQGAASLLRNNGHRLLEMASLPTVQSTSDQTSLCLNYGQHHSAQFVCRMIIWMAAVDAGAASYGLGGNFNAALDQMIDGTEAENPGLTLQRALSNIHRQSGSLFRSFWGGIYPQSEIMDDLKNRPIFDLLREASRLRHMVAELQVFQRADAAVAERREALISHSIQEIEDGYADILETASTLRLSAGDDRRLICNIRYIVPHFHAIVLAFHRVTHSSETLGERQRRALSEIISLSFLSFKDEGDQALFRMAWPLFMAGLETNDLVHQQWILDRFKSLEKFGKNFARAYRLLEAMTRDQDLSGTRADIFRYLESNQFERFFI